MAKAKGKGPAVTKEIGETYALGASIFGGKFELYSGSSITPAMLHSMCEVDGQAAAALQLVTAPMAEAQWEIRPAKADKGEAEFVRDALSRPPHEGGMSTPFGQVIAQMGLAVVSGYADFEKVPESKDGAWVFQKIPQRPSCTALVSADGSFAGLRQQTSTGQKDIPVEVAVRHVCGRKYHPLLGHSMFRAAYGHYKTKWQLYYVANLAASVGALGLKHGTYPHNMNDPQKIEKFAQDLAALGIQNTIVTPDGYEVNLLNAQSRLPTIMPYIEHHDTLIVRPVLGQFIMLGSQGGSFALNESQTELFLRGLQSVLNEIGDTVNCYVLPDLVNWNFANPAYPTFAFLPMSDAMRASLIAVFTGLSTSPTPNVSEEFKQGLERKVAAKFDIPLPEKLTPAVNTNAGAAAPIALADTMSTEHRAKSRERNGMVRLADSGLSGRARKDRTRAWGKVLDKATGEMQAPAEKYLKGLLDDNCEWIASKANVPVYNEIARQREAAQKSTADKAMEQWRAWLDKKAQALVDTAPETAVPEKEFKAAFLSSYDLAGAQGLQDLGLADVNFALKDRAILDVLWKRRAPQVKDVSDSVRESIKNILVKQIGEEPAHPYEIARRLRESGLIEDLSVSSARRIARTESANVLGEARMDIYKRNGTSTHEWLTAGDGEVRDQHEINNGVIRPVGVAFPSGQIFPGQGSADQVINCRCTTAPVDADFEVTAETAWTGQEADGAEWLARQELRKE